MCPVRERQVEVTRITVVQKVLYAEAVKRVVEEDGSRVKDPERIPVIRPMSIESDRNNMLQYFLFFWCSWPWLSTVPQE